MLSEEWKKEAIKRFPEFTSEDHDGWDNPYQCWIDLSLLFKKAYEPLRNEDVIKRVYDYAFWCFDQPGGATAEDDLGTCVVVSSLEDIPTIEEAMNDMPRWFTLEMVKGSEEVFSYMVGKEGFQRILDVYKHNSEK